MALNFPANPSAGDVHNASNNFSYFFDGVKWTTQGTFNTGTINTIKLDSLTSSFNGSLTTFNLTSNSVSVKPANAQSVMISLGGVIQEPTTAYTINSETGTITFASAPASSTAFFGIVYSRLPQSTTTVDDGAITNAKVNATAAIDKSKLNISDATTSASGYMSASDKTKLDGIETSATADQTNAEIRAAVEAATDSNVFTDADHTKLNGIEANATADQTASEIVALLAGQTVTVNNILFGSDTADANKLDGYEEGTWTPTVLSGGTIGSSQYTSTYTKIGRLVTINTDIHQLSDTTSNTNIAIGGLPYVPSGTSGNWSAVCHGERYGNDIIVAFLQYGSSGPWRITFRKGVGVSGYADLKHSDNNAATDNNLRFTLTYELTT